MSHPSRGRPSVRAAAFGLALSLVLAACSGAGTTSGTQQASVPGYRVLRDVRLPGGTSRWDYQVYDPAARRLYIAHLGASQIVVFDTVLQKVVGIVRGIAGVHGLALAPGLGRLFATATDRNRVVAIDLATLKVLASVPAGNYPDGVTYAPPANAIFISDEGGSGDSVVDAQTDQPLGAVKLGTGIGNSQYDPTSGFVYVAVGGGSNELVEVDPARRAVVAAYPLDGCGGAHGVQVDAARQRVFVACEDNATLVVFSLTAKRVTQAFDVGDGPDVLAEDVPNHRLYVASESGQLSVFDVADSVDKLSQGKAGPDAHSVAVDPTTHVVYLPLTDVGGHPVLRELEPQWASCWLSDEKLQCVT